MLTHGLSRSDHPSLDDAQWERYQSEFRTRKLADLRREIQLGLADLARGDALPADELFRRLRERNQGAEKRGT